MSGPTEEGTVEAVLPKALYQVRLDSGSQVKAAMSTDARRTIVKLLPGDRVAVELSPYDPTRGRITARF